jgi:hypothetical protein
MFISLHLFAVVELILGGQMVVTPKDDVDRVIVYKKTYEQMRASMEPHWIFWMPLAITSLAGAEVRDSRWHGL